MYKKNDTVRYEMIKCKCTDIAVYEDGDRICLDCGRVQFVGKREIKHTTRGLWLDYILREINNKGLTFIMGPGLSDMELLEALEIT